MKKTKKVFTFDSLILQTILLIVLSTRCFAFNPDSMNLRYIAPFGEKIYGREMIIQDDYAFINYLGLKIYNISDINNITMASSLNLRGILSLQDSMACMVEDNVLQIININNPLLPKVIGKSYIKLKRAMDAVLTDKSIFIADLENGVHIIDILNPENPRLACIYNTPGKAWSLDVKDNYLYIADLNYGLRIVDITNINEPKEIGYFDLNEVKRKDRWGDFKNIEENEITDVSVSGNKAYVIDTKDGLSIIDIAQRNRPKKLSSIRYPGFSKGNVKLIGDIALVTSSWGIDLINVTNKYKPMRLGYYCFPSACLSATIKNGLVFVITADDGLCVLKGYGKAKIVSTLK